MKWDGMGVIARFATIMKGRAPGKPGAFSFMPKYGD